MMREEEIKEISRFMSLVLRHKPEAIRLTLDEEGWADTGELLEKLQHRGFPLSPEGLIHLVNTNNKQRFSFNADKSRIRANQGHSIQVNLHLAVADPPEYLYHGTGEKSVSAILADGLHKQNRHHVHLSIDPETALAVGKRHGKPRIFRVAARQMRLAGHLFYLSENQVWLTDLVPAPYLELL